MTMDSFYNTAITVLAVIGAIRLVFLPIVGGINVAIKNSPSTEDDIKWEKIKTSWWFLLLQYLLDYAAGVQIVPPEKKE